MWQKYNHIYVMLVLCNMTMKPSNVSKNKGIIKCDNSTVICDVDIVQCNDRTIKCEWTIREPPNMPKV